MITSGMIIGMNDQRLPQAHAGEAVAVEQPGAAGAEHHREHAW